MRILYVTHKMIYPITGGDCIRMSQMLDGLLRHGEVDVMYIAHGAGTGTMKSYNPAIGSEWCLHVSFARRLYRAAATLFGRYPFLVSLYRHKAFGHRLMQVAPEYDMVVLGGLGVAGYCVDLKEAGIDVRLDITDSATMNLDNEVRLSSGLKKLWNRINARRMRRFELLWRSTVTATAFISDVDQRYLDVDGSRSVVVGNMVALCEDRMICDHASGNEILFVGNMGYAPNIAAVKRFAMNVLPDIAAAVPDVRFRIVGASPGREVKNLENRFSNVSVDGFVENLDGCYRSASIVVAPMFSGSGIQNKILQAMAAGCCVVTTPIGAEGLDINSGAFAIGRDDAELARICISLLNDSTVRRDYGLRARSYVAANFSSAQIARQLDAFLQ